MYMIFRLNIEPHENAELISFIKSLHINIEDAIKFHRNFDIWSNEHKHYLKDEYVKSGVPISIKEWALRIYMITLFDKYKETIKNEIKQLTGETNE